MPHAFAISTKDLDGLARDPRRVLSGTVGGVRYEARVVIADYGERIARHYGTPLPNAPVEFPFRHFGLRCELEAPVELRLYDTSRVLCATTRDMIARFGPVSFTNAYLDPSARADGQRNIFPSLDFHYDRAPDQNNQYSLFFRDPFDAVQRAPRDSTTLVLANVAAYLQERKEGGDLSKFRSLHHLFEGEDIATLIDEILLEQRWSAPAGSGEIIVFDNRTVLHASYYNGKAGYPIGVRYLI
ncbi:MAG: hypothetical protein IIB66_11065 [Proteobacteria bacterium]|nr:hypothetical protein [Pseudomonadota bacterium]